MLDETPKTLDFLGGIISNEVTRLVANEALRVKLGQLELLEAQNKDLKAKIEELTMKNNNAEDELEAVKKKQAEQWLIMLLCIISTLTLSTMDTQKINQKDESVKPMKVSY